MCDLHCCTTHVPCVFVCNTHITGSAPHGPPIPGCAAGMGHVIQHCSELVDEQVLKRVLVSVNSTVAILGRSAGRGWEAGQRWEAGLTASSVFTCPYSLPQQQVDCTEDPNARGECQDGSAPTATLSHSHFPSASSL